jgi:hypothetical protein
MSVTASDTAHPGGHSQNFIKEISWCRYLLPALRVKDRDYCSAQRLVSAPQLRIKPAMPPMKYDRVVESGAHSSMRNNQGMARNQEFIRRFSAEQLQSK